MRWLSRSRGLPRRIAKRFALFPVYCEDVWCWLEIFYMDQRRVNRTWYNYHWSTKDECLAWREELKSKETT